MRAAAIGLCAGLALAAVAAAAEEEVVKQAGAALGASPEERFRNLDRDGDGSISWEEFRNSLTRVFYAEDPDDDGRLQAGDAGTAAAAAGRSITIEEWTASGQTVFVRIDANGDGLVSLDEYLASKPFQPKS